MHSNVIFFFSSRRRHTRWPRDWSSDVCSSDLLSYLAVVVVGLAVAAITISGLLLRYEDDQTRVHLEELSAPFLTAIQTGVRAGQQPREIVDALTEQAHAANARLLITTAARRVAIDSDGRLVGSLLPQPSASSIGEFTEGADQWIFVRQQLRQAAAGGVGLGFIVVARPRAVFTDTLRALLPSLALSGLVALAFAVLVAALLARTITRPLRDLVGGVRRFAGGDYGTRVPLAGPSEVAEMGTAFLLESAVAALEVQAKDAGVSFDVAGADALPSLRGDPDKLAQLFLNVLDNAVKHSPRGTTVHVRGSRDDGAVIVRVRDSGSGLPQGAQTRLFQRFYRGENAQRDGAGLGLAIAQAIAQAHGGSIRASNVEGGGAEFAVRLPIAKTT